jgi:16S rRNA (cytosine1402-N4)-methyltransferase
VQHLTVMLEEAVAALVTDPDGFYIDGTFGRGGHSTRILQELGPAGRLLVLDKDPQALAVAYAMQKQEPRLLVGHGSFADMRRFVIEAGSEASVAGVLLDLGVSSPQLDDPARGFSFSKDGPLDMRMDTSAGPTAAQWLAEAPEEEIARVLYEYGEEKFSRRMARAIVEERAKQQLVSTLQLADIIARANPKWERHKHPATRAFQGIRIFINRELEDLERALAAALDLLQPGGRLVVISFHSLEDRIVKQFFRREAMGEELPARLPVTRDQIRTRLKLVGKKQKASPDEVAGNIRARSAVMRVAEKTG